MNKRKAKKKYKQIYEDELENGVICIDLDRPFPRTVRLKSNGRLTEIGVSFREVSVTPTSTNLYPDFTLSGSWDWYKQKKLAR